MIKEKARFLRKNQTEAEQVLWAHLRNRRQDGYKFLRQYPIRFKLNEKPRMFIADFYCAKRKLIIEVDGGIHEKQKDYDNIRSEFLVTSGYLVIRFSNQEVINNTTEVLNKIKDALA